MTVVIDGTTGITSPAESLSGNLTFTGTGNRITGDFSNATVASRVLFQSTTPNANTRVGMLPTIATGGTAGPVMYSTTDTANCSFFDIRITDGVQSALISEKAGTGTYLPMTFFTGGSERMRIDAGGTTSEFKTASTGASILKSSGGTASYGSFYAYNAGNAANFNYIFFGDAGGEKARITQGTDGALYFSNGSGATTRATIDANGNFLVGNTTAEGQLAISAAGTTALFAKSSGTTNATYATIMRNSAGTNLFYVRSDGYFVTGSGSFSPYNYTTGFAANVYIDSIGGLLRSTSSLKYKTDVQNATHGLAKAMMLRPVTYKGKNDGEKVFGGLIAEEVHEAGLTEFVQYAEDGTPDALAYGNMVSLCIKAIQEQQAIIEQLKADVAELKAAK